MTTVRVVHYLNQFFGGIGGEDRADAPLEFRSGPVGPGLALQQALGDKAEVTHTIICGDNEFSENKQAVLERIVEHVRGLDADVFVAGPAFNAGRYGIACAEVCYAVEEQLRMPTVTAMHPENPGTELHKEALVVVPTAAAAIGMAQAIPHVARLAMKRAAGEPLGPATDEGYLPRGPRRNQFHDTPAAARAVAMLHAKLADKPFTSEVPLETYEQVAPAAAVDPAKARVALVSEAGVVPKGNPDRLRHVLCDVWAAYDLGTLDDFRAGEYEVVHGGYDAGFVLDSPPRMVPVDSVRSMVDKGDVGELHEEYVVTVGNGNPVSNVQRLGREMAAHLKQSGVDCIILTST